MSQSGRQALAGANSVNLAAQQQAGTVHWMLVMHTPTLQSVWWSQLGGGRRRWQSEAVEPTHGGPADPPETVVPEPLTFAVLDVDVPDPDRRRRPTVADHRDGVRDRQAGPGVDVRVAPYTYTSPGLSRK